MSKGFKEVNLHGCVSGKLEVPVIGENGNWFIGNDDTNIPATGADGEPGPMGPQGIKGDKGEQGNIGPAGPQGIQGIQGEKGDKGETGPQGTQGIQGEKGDKGETGPQGTQGIQGEKGDKGEQGTKGDRGDTGATGIQGPKGDKGDLGPQGPIGATPSLAANLTTTAAGKALDATMGKVLDDKCSQINSNLTSNVNVITGTWLGNNKISFDGTNFYATAANGVKKKLGEPTIKTIVKTNVSTNTSDTVYNIALAGYTPIVAAIKSITYAATGNSNTTICQLSCVLSGNNITIVSTANATVGADWWDKIELIVVYV